MMIATIFETWCNTCGKPTDHLTRNGWCWCVEHTQRHAGIHPDNNHLAKPHPCPLYGCMVLVPGGVFACEQCTAEFTSEERVELDARWMQAGFDTLVDRILNRVRAARVSSP